MESADRSGGDRDASHDEFAENKKDLAKKLKGKKGEKKDKEFDEIMSQFLIKVPPGEGDEFAAVKPWLGAIKEPKNHPKPIKKAPDEDFGIDWVYGYRNEDVR